MSSFWLKVPQDVWVLVLQHLKLNELMNVRVTSAFCQKLTLIPHTWNYIDVAFDNINQYENVPANALKCFRNMRLKLSRKWQKRKPPAFFAQLILNHRNNLQAFELDPNGFAISCACFAQIAQLKHLRLLNLQKQTEHFNRETLHLILGLKQMKYLYLPELEFAPSSSSSSCSSFPSSASSLSDSLTAIQRDRLCPDDLLLLKQLPELQFLHVWAVSQMVRDYDDYYIDLLDRAVSAIGSLGLPNVALAGFPTSSFQNLFNGNFKSLTSLSLDIDIHLQDIHIPSLCSALANLQRLFIRVLYRYENVRARDLTDNVFEIVRNVHWLKELYMTFPFRSKNYSVLNLLEKYRHLTSLHLDKFFDVSASFLHDQLPLKTLSLIKCRIKGSQAEFLSKIPSGVVRLDLKNTDLYLGSHRLLLLRFKNLQRLDIGGNPDLLHYSRTKPDPARAVELLSSIITSLPSGMQFLGLSALPRLDRAVIDAIIRSCPLLKQLDIAKTPIVEEDVRSLLERLPHLTRLFIDENDDVPLPSNDKNAFKIKKGSGNSWTSVMFSSPLLDEDDSLQRIVHHKDQFSNNS